MDEAYKADVETGGAGRQVFRLVATLLGVALAVAGAFADWVPGTPGDRLTVKALVRPDLATDGDIVKTAGGLSILIALVALVGLVDRTGWLSRLAGVAALVVFVMFAIEAYRSYGQDLGTTAHHMQAGAWLLLAGGLVVLIAGIHGSRTVVGVPATREERRVLEEQQH